MLQFTDVLNFPFVMVCQCVGYLFLLISFRKILETIKEHERSKEADLAKMFSSDLKVAKDGFTVVANYFGKGVFQRVRLASPYYITVPYGYLTVMSSYA